MRAGQVEAFAAWRRFFEALAEDGPTVLVFEDIHWADDALLGLHRSAGRPRGRGAVADRLHRPAGTVRTPRALGVAARRTPARSR